MANTATKTRKPVKRSAAKAAPEPMNIDWVELMEKALTVPGSLGNQFNRFYNYSFFNMIWLMVQGVNEPVATYRRWGTLGRQVRKGSKGKTVLHPVIVTKRDPETKKPILDKNGKQQRIVIGFQARPTVFALSDTDGPDLELPEIPDWDLELAMKTLGITRVEFATADGNTGGYSTGSEIAINPVNDAPMHTAFHELGHVVLGHTKPEGVKEYQTHRGSMEFEAESVAYLVSHELELTEKGWDASASRAYIQGWLKGKDVTDAQIKAVFSATNKILVAGRPKKDDDSE